MAAFLGETFARNLNGNVEKQVATSIKKTQAGQYHPALVRHKNPMNQNLCEAGTATQRTARTRPTRWMIVVGSASLCVAALCLLVTGALMMWSFDTIAKSSTTPEPSDLATGISTAMIPSVATVPLGIVGIVFLILGFIRRQPASRV